MAKRDRQATRWKPLFLDFIEKLRIDSKEVAAVDDRGSPLNLWGSQRIALNEICDGLEAGIRDFLCLKSRQLGITTITLAIDLFWLAMHPGMRGALVSDTDGNREIFRTTLARYMASFPPGYLGQSFVIEKHNRNFLMFSDGSRLDYLVAGTKSKATWGESRGYTLVHSTETANYGDPAGIHSFRETLAESHPDRLFIWESTAKGWNHYRDMYIEYGRDTLTKRRFFVGWWSKEINSISARDPRYEIYGLEKPNAVERELMELVYTRHQVDVKPEQLAWYRWRQSDSSSDTAALNQNNPWTAEQAFVLTGYSFFQTRLIQKNLEYVYNTPVMFLAYRFWLGNEFHLSRLEQIVHPEQLPDADLRIWEEPVEEGQYVIGFDPAFGRNDWQDNHCGSVFRCYADRLVQVAEYADNRVETHQAAWVLAYLASIYKNCIVNLEINGPGRAIMTEFKNLRNQMRSPDYIDKRTTRKWDDFLDNARWYLYHRPDAMGAGYVYNFSTNYNTKFEIMNQLRDNYSIGVMQVNSGAMLEEMLTVIQDGGEIGAPGRGKDDRVFAAALANRAYIDWVRADLIARGATYEKVTAAEEGRQVAPAEVVNAIVHNYFKRKDEEMEDPEYGFTEEQRYMRDRGLA